MYDHPCVFADGLQAGIAVWTPSRTLHTRMVSRQYEHACAASGESCGRIVCHTKHTRTTAAQYVSSDAPTDVQTACSSCHTTINQSIKHSLTHAVSQSIIWSIDHWNSQKLPVNILSEVPHDVIQVWTYHNMITAYYIKHRQMQDLLVTARNCWRW